MHRAGAAEGTPLEVTVRRCCALVVAAVAAYASYIHQRNFALQGGADKASASLWPLSVDGLLLLATLGLLKSPDRSSQRARYAVWLAFGLGIAVSLAANIAAAPSISWQPVLVAGWPPVALLLAVELLAHRSRVLTQAETASLVAGESAGEADVENPAPGQEAADPLVVRARQRDAEHRRLHQRPVSAETIRKEFRIGAKRSRELVAVVRANGSPGTGRELSKSDSM